MNETIICPFVMVLAVFVASCSQILLKSAANRRYKSRLAEYMNIRVIAAYILFGISAVVAMLILRYITLSLMTILESSSYIFVAILSYCILKESITKRKLIGIILIILGTVLFMVEVNFL